MFCRVGNLLSPSTLKGPYKNKGKEETSVEHQLFLKMDSDGETLFPRKKKVFDRRPGAILRKLKKAC